MTTRPRQLYFIADVERLYVKIGLSRTPASRLFDLQAGSPLELCVELVMENCARSEEERLHQAWARHWRHREWFDYADEIKARVDAALASGEWNWAGIPAARARYDGSFGGQLSHYEFLAAAKSATL